MHIGADSLGGAVRAAVADALGFAPPPQPAAAITAKRVKVVKVV
ncbi:MAG TPA: hypothetical protein VLB89_03340 [Gaiellaceae bacterium]|nr:hypothetical protein [Gaiellaceae bacterium]